MVKLQCGLLFQDSSGAPEKYSVEWEGDYSASDSGWLDIEFDHVMKIQVDSSSTLIESFIYLSMPV